MHGPSKGRFEETGDIELGASYSSRDYVEAVAPQVNNLNLKTKYKVGKPFIQFIDQDINYKCLS